jgi:glycosyltransferase involved in cell wall biosynthesis
MERLVRDERPDVAHVHNTWYRWTPSVFSALGKADVPVVMTAHNYRLVCANGVLWRNEAPCTDCVGSHPWHAVSHRCYRGSAAESLIAASTIALNRSIGTWARNVDRFIVTSRFAADVLQRSGIAADRIRIVPPLIPDPGPRFNAPSESGVVVYIGRIDTGKGLDLLLDAWQQAGSDLELLVIGTGPMLSTFDQRRVRGVRFAGWLDHAEAMDTLRSARALAFPSLYYETLGMSLVEALAAGVPVVANDLGPRREVTGDEGAAWLADPGSLDEWVAAIRNLSDDAGVDAAGTAARHRYESTYAVPTALSELEGVYEEVVAEGSIRA